MLPSPRPQNGVPTQSDNEIVDLIPALRAFARTLYRNRCDADDLVQETLTKGLANIHRFQAGTNMKSWLFTIMRNTFYTRGKIARREVPGIEDCASLRPAVDPEQEWSVRGIEVREAVQRLPEQQRQVLVLVGVLGVSYQEAAEICGCAMGTVKSRLNRARLRLLDELGENAPRATVEATDEHPVASIKSSSFVE
ncbi:sigma-70 family RNA polymerase sigma factor [Chelativorans xinjiangense]|uniref:sigma-70 family RNA polymerase sigma factor n=1 Tax=Chelativorans xinjiangense TaxID=2681485 RepID=UPI00135B5F97|nr:sigma-70 family RNA polymerase sigma factor [Chelativorans xinjiangense]